MANSSRTAKRGAEVRLVRRTGEPAPVDPAAAKVRRRIEDIKVASVLESLDPEHWYSDLSREAPCRR